MNYRNIMITFLVSGLWHGASWSFITWGGLHGVYQIIGSVLRPWKDRCIARYKFKSESFSYKLGQVCITFILVDFAWIFFRMNSLKYSLDFVGRIFRKWNPWVLFDQSLYELGLNQTEVHILFFSLAVLFLADLVRYRKKETLDIFLSGQCIWFRWGAIFLLIFSIIIFGIYGPGFDATQFIYFQF